MRRLISIWTRKTTDKPAAGSAGNTIWLFHLHLAVGVRRRSLSEADQIKNELAPFSIRNGFALQMIEVSGRNQTESAAIRSC